MYIILSYRDTFIFNSLEHVVKLYPEDAVVSMPATLHRSPRFLGPARAPVRPGAAPRIMTPGVTKAQQSNWRRKTFNRHFHDI